MKEILYLLHPLGPAQDQLGVRERTALLHEELHFPGETMLIDLA
jgi:hypothetical protein